LNFIDDAKKLGDFESGDASLAKTNYLGQTLSYKGEDKIQNLLYKIKVQVKKDRIRL